MRRRAARAERLHKELVMQTARWMRDATIAAAAASACWLVHAEGLKPPSDTMPWARWQARLALGTTPAPQWRSGADLQDHRLSSGVGSASLMGDYYFSRSLAAGGVASGFRATSGLIVGPRTALWTARPNGMTVGSPLQVERRLFDLHTGSVGSDAATPDSATLPYLGVGYSGLSLRGGWSVNADLGLVALAPGSVKFGRMFGGTQSVDELLRDLRLTPVIQLGVSYSF
jgi:hypothetical protein